MIGIIERLQDARCKEHHFNRIRTIHGDERNMGYCSEWQCQRCGCFRLSERMDILEGHNGQWWTHE